MSAWDRTLAWVRSEPWPGHTVVEPPPEPGEFQPWMRYRATTTAVPGDRFTTTRVPTAIPTSTDANLAQATTTDVGLASPTTTPAP